MLGGLETVLSREDVSDGGVIPGDFQSNNLILRHEDNNLVGLYESLSDGNSVVFPLLDDLYLAEVHS